MGGVLGVSDASGVDTYRRGGFWRFTCQAINPVLLSHPRKASQVAALYRILGWLCRILGWPFESVTAICVAFEDNITCWQGDDLYDNWRDEPFLPFQS